jgi:hypothetical protein
MAQPDRGLDEDVNAARKGTIGRLSSDWRSRPAIVTIGSALALTAALVGVACSGSPAAPAAPAALGGTTEVRLGGLDAVELNLSQIDWVETRQVEIHFVLLSDRPPP